MARSDIIQKIAAGVEPGADDNAVVESSNLVAKRMGAAPMDATEVFTDMLSAQAYADGTLKSKYQNGSKSYVGQHIAVVDTSLSSADMFIIQNTAGKLRKITASPLSGQTFDFNGKTLGDVLVAVISSLGGTALNA